MTYDELISRLKDGRADGWVRDHNRGIFILKDDLNVTIREQGPDWKKKPEPFMEPWARKFPDRNAYETSFELWYGSYVLKVYPFVVVDGGRALMPMPRAHDDLTITQEQYGVAAVVNPDLWRDYSRYFGRFKIAW